MNASLTQVLLRVGALVERQAARSLWSVARGLARRVGRYKALLMEADAPRQHAAGGRGTLSLVGLMRFTDFFLESCIDQVEFMQNLLEPDRVDEDLWR